MHTKSLYTSVNASRLIIKIHTQPPKHIWNPILFLGDNNLALFKLAGNIDSLQYWSSVLSWEAIALTHTVRGRICFKETVQHWTRIHILFVLFDYCLLPVIHTLIYSHTRTRSVLLLCVCCRFFNILLGSQFGDMQEKLESGETVAQFIKSYFEYNHDFVGSVALIVVGLAVLFGSIFALSIKAFNFKKR